MKRCPQCHQSYSDEFSFCQNDGVNLVTADTPVAAGASTAVGKKPAVSPAVLWGVVTVTCTLVIGGLGWSLGRSQTPPVEVPPQSPPVTPEPAVTHSYEAPPVAAPTPDPLVQERAAILQVTESWKSAWERLDVAAYMAHYAPEARIYSNRKWYTRDAYEQHERDLFSYGGNIRVTLGQRQINIYGNMAEVSFPFQFQRTGGKGNYKSRGHEKFKMQKNSAGTWVIIEDMFTKH